MAIYDVDGNILSSGGTSGESPIAGKRIIMIGDSNTQYSAESLKTYMETTYGCTFIPSGFAGATWETSNGVDTTDNSAVGKVNSIVANANESKLITEYDTIIIMMGTNCNSVGTLTDTSAQVDTMCGAIRYCLEKLCYYGRQIKLGIIIPLRGDGNYNIAENMGSMPERFRFIQELARQYAVPTLNIHDEGRIIPNSYTPDGTSYYLGDSVHFGGNGTLQFKQRLGKWIAYEL